MTNGVRQKSRRPHTLHDACDLNAQSPAMRAIEAISTVVRLKRGDAFDLAKDKAKLVYAVRSGYLILQADLFDARRVGIALHAPGSIFRLCDLPQFKSLKAVATVQCQLLRMGEGAFERLCEQSADVRLYWAREASKQSAREKSHIVLLAGFSGDEKVARFFVDLAYRIGRRQNGIVAVEVPFSRCDIANFLALNPDTLSRIFSRLKAGGFIRTSGRRGVEILDLDGLAKMVPAEMDYGVGDSDSNGETIKALLAEGGR